MAQDIVPYGIRIAKQFPQLGQLHGYRHVCHSYCPTAVKPVSTAFCDANQFMFIFEYRAEHSLG